MKFIGFFYRNIKFFLPQYESHQCSLKWSEKRNKEQIFFGLFVNVCIPNLNYLIEKQKVFLQQNN